MPPSPPVPTAVVLSTGHILAEFWQNQFTKGIAAAVSEMRRLETLNILISLFGLKNREI